MYFKKTWFPRDKPMKLIPVVSYTLSQGIVLSVAYGDATSFKSTKGAIVVAADPTLTPFSKAIEVAGGRALKKAISKLTDDPFAAGSAVAVGPHSFVGIGVPYVIHAIPPDFRRFACYDFNSFLADTKLMSCYTAALNETLHKPIEQVVFTAIPPNSQKNNAGSPTVTHLIAAAARTIEDWSMEIHGSKVTDIVLCTSDIMEATEIIKGCDLALGNDAFKISKIKD